MADVTQLHSDLASLTAAVAEDAAAIASVQAFAKSQGAEIVNLQQQIATLKSGSGQDLDLSQLEASVNALRSQNTLLQGVIPSSPVSAPPPPAPSAPPAPPAQPVQPVTAPVLDPATAPATPVQADSPASVQAGAVPASAVSTNPVVSTNPAASTTTVATPTSTPIAS